jgi:glycosyltransferase involved in cell wall biosynthesis
VVAANVRGVPDVVQDGHTGLLAPGGDSSALADHVSELLDSPERRRAMGKAAATFAARSRSLEVAARQLAHFLPP